MIAAANAAPAAALTAEVERLPLEEGLAEIAERIAAEIEPEARARLLNLAGDLCHVDGQRERALLYYDAAIDLYLVAGRFAASATICEKLVSLNPDIVRARCTLAWLAIARGLDDEAARRIDEYGEAAVRLERPTVAQRQLRAMAQEVDGERVLSAIAEGLLRLGDAVTADRIFGLAHHPSPRPRRVYANAADRERAIISRLTNAWSG